ncbi:MAG: hypothetical protein JXB07_04465 [Anaerolineae bacterium]|nr:hypothetical protein [Anaerolineae bacterium]
MKQSYLLLVMFLLLCAACRSDGEITGPLSDLPADARKALDRGVKDYFDVNDYTVVAVQKSQSGKSWCVVFDPPLKAQSLWYDYAVVQPDGSGWKAVMIEDHQGGTVLSFAGCKAVYKQPPAPTESLQPTGIPVVPTQLPGPTATPSPTPTPTDCTGATFVSPQNDSAVAAGDIPMTWEPSGCVMVVQYYQQEKLINEYPDASSGIVINIPEPGLTELKIWVPGASGPSDAIWITVE